MLSKKKRERIEHLQREYLDHRDDMAYWHILEDYENYMIAAKRASRVKQEILAIRRPKRWASFGFSEV